MKIEEMYQELTKEIPSEQIYRNEPMSKHTTFKVGGNADIFVKTKNIKELTKILDLAKKNDVPITIMGNGSNILVRDKGIRGIVIKIEFENIEIKPIDDKNVIVTVGAGVVLARLAQELLKKHVTGFEFASGIPGTIGGAIKMNAGAYGNEMKDVVISTKCLNLNKEIKTNAILELTNEEQLFSYRHSIFGEKRQYVIIEAKLKLQFGEEEQIRSKMEELTNNRKEKQPNKPSAGSTFKRGEDFITAKLIDECGLKGKQIGGAQVSEKHAGFIVNTGNATAQNILDLIDYVKKVVYEKTNKMIQLEIEVLGE